MKHYFGGELYFLCFAYLEDFKQEPRDYDTLFGYLRYKKTKNILAKVGEEIAKSMTGDKT